MAAEKHLHMAKQASITNNLKVHHTELQMTDDFRQKGKTHKT